jgi:hypothetical protein
MGVWDKRRAFSAQTRDIKTAAERAAEVRAKVPRRPRLRGRGVPTGEVYDGTRRFW